MAEKSGGPYQNAVSNTERASQNNYPFAETNYSTYSHKRQLSKNERLGIENATTSKDSNKNICEDSSKNSPRAYH